MEMHLTRALAALRADAPASALHHLLTAWRERRDARVSALVEAVGARVPGAPVAGSDLVRAWKSRANASTAEDIGPLLASLLEGAQVADVAARIERLGKLPPDPRVAARYVALLRQPPFTASSHKPVWVRLLQQIAHVHGDPRTIAAAAALAPGYTRVFGATVMGRWMQTQLEKLARALPGDGALAPLSAKHEELLTALEAALPAPAAPAAPPEDAGDALLRAIADDPHDAARRDAYRAWLVAQGGERAEFVALQERLHAGEALSAAEAARVKSLPRAHRTDWLGPLAPVVTEERFDRGLLSACMLWPKGAKTGPAIGDPRWATVETIVCVGAMRAKGNDVVLHPMLRGLRRLEDAPPELVEALLRDPLPRALEVIEGEALHPRALPADLAAPGLPRLREFTVSCWYRDDAVSKYTATWRPPSELRPFLQSPLAARLAVLRWSAHFTFLGDVAAELDAHAPPGFTARVELLYFALSRGPDGRWSRADVTIERVDDELKRSDARLRTLLQLDPARVAEVAVRLAAGEDASKLAEQLAAVRERFPRAAVTVTTG